MGLREIASVAASIGLGYYLATKLYGEKSSATQPVKDAPTPPTPAPSTATAKNQGATAQPAISAPKGGSTVSTFDPNYPRTGVYKTAKEDAQLSLSLIHISEPTRLLSISYAV